MTNGYHLLAPLFMFALAASMTPGPNVIMLAASGVNHGFRRTIPHMIGITVGFPTMLLALGLGLDQIFAAWPQIHYVLKIAGTLYLLYFACRIALSATAGEAGGPAVPLSFMQAVIFQWVNPKAWVVGLSAFATFTTVGRMDWSEIALICTMFFLVSFPSVGVWCLFGTQIRRYLTSTRHLKIFNYIMGGLLAASVLVLYM